MNFFFGGAFSTYGSEVPGWSWCKNNALWWWLFLNQKSHYMTLPLYDQVLKMSNLDPERRNDPLNDVFPKVKVHSLYVRSKLSPDCKGESYKNSIYIWKPVSKGESFFSTSSKVLIRGKICSHDNHCPSWGASKLIFMFDNYLSQRKIHLRLTTRLQSAVSTSLVRPALLKPMMDFAFCR